MSENVLERFQVSFGFNIEVVYDVLESLRISLSVSLHPLMCSVPTIN
jgi:hypothetical protein